MSIIVSRKQRNLMLNSNTINKKRFIEIRSLLEANEALTMKLLENTHKGEVMLATIPSLLLAVQSEWIEDSENPAVDLGVNFAEVGQSCSLCGHKPIRLKYSIKNRYNGKKLIVGSECVKEFGEVIQSQFKHSAKLAKRAQRINVINEKFPSISYIVEHWKNEIEKSPIVISQVIEKKWNQTGQELLEVYNTYINGKSEKAVAFSNIKKLLKERNHLLVEIDDFVLMNESRPFIAKRSIANWLQKNNKSSVLEIIKEDNGYIEWRSAHRITEQNFMLEMAKLFEESLISIGLKIDGLSRGSTEYVISFSNSRFRSVKMLYNYSDFILEYGGEIFPDEEKNEINLNKIFSQSKLYGESSFDRVLDEISYKTRGYIISYKSLRDNEIIFNYEEETYYLLPLREFCEKYKMLILNRYIFDANDIIEYLKTTGTIMNERKFKLHLEAKEVAFESKRK